MRKFRLSLAICYSDRTWKNHDTIVELGSAALPTENDPTEGDLLDALGDDNYPIPEHVSKLALAVGLLSWMEISND